jgi:hypothetical protein
MPATSESILRGLPVCKLKFFVGRRTLFVKSAYWQFPALKFVNLVAHSDTIDRLGGTKLKCRLLILSNLSSIFIKHKDYNKIETRLGALTA